MKTATKKKFKTTAFWSAIVSATILFVQSVALTLGYEIPAELTANILTSVNSLLALMTIGGILVDSKEVDSFQALTVKAKKQGDSFHMMLKK